MYTTRDGTVLKRTPFYSLCFCFYDTVAIINFNKHLINFKSIHSSSSSSKSRIKRDSVLFTPWHNNSFINNNFTSYNKQQYKEEGLTKKSSSSSSFRNINVRFLSLLTSRMSFIIKIKPREKLIFKKDTVERKS